MSDKITFKMGSFCNEIAYFLFSPDSKHYAYRATVTIEENATEEHYLILDGEEVAGPYIDLECVQFSPDSKRIAFWAKNKEVAMWFPVVGAIKAEK